MIPHSPPSLCHPRFRLSLPVLVLAASVLLLLPPCCQSSPPLHLSVEKFTVFINNTAFFVKGVCYNPSALGTAPALTPPWGDYLMPAYAQSWERDFPVMRSMGVNTVRVWQWDNNNDHGTFLDAAYRHGMKVIVTFYIGNSGQFPVQQEWQRQQILGTFKWQVQRYLHHPALLAWSFGAEINAPWNGFLPAFSNAFGCNWAPATAPTGCFNDPLTSPDSGCHQSIACVYQHVFEFLNTAALYAKDVMGGQPSHLILAGVADVDVLTSRFALYEHYAPAVDGWAVQIYRGRDFGTGDDDFLRLYEKHSRKPLIVSEYGVDAYNDPCGDADKSPCYNFAHAPPAGYGEDEETQADWLVGLTELLANHSSAQQRGPVAGGCIYEWQDEYWRSTTGVTGCFGPIPYGLPGFNPAQCDWKAHVDCPESDLWYHSLCGYPSTSFDHYTNAAWFGLVKPFPNPGHDADTVVPRVAYDRIRDIWGEQAGPRGWVWVLLLLGVLLTAMAVSGLVWLRWMRRYGELERLGVRPSWWKLWTTREHGDEYVPIDTVEDVSDGEHDKREIMEDRAMHT